MNKPNVPATVANLDHNVVIEVLSRNACNVSDAAVDLGVPPRDLRRLMRSNPQLQDQAFEIVEQRLDKAEKNIAEALYSDDSRRRDARRPPPVRPSLSLMVDMPSDPSELVWASGFSFGIAKRGSAGF